MEKSSAVEIVTPTSNVPILTERGSLYAATTRFAVVFDCATENQPLLLEEKSVGLDSPVAKLIFAIRKQTTGGNGKVNFLRGSDKPEKQGDLALGELTPEGVRKTDTKDDLRSRNQ